MKGVFFLPTFSWNSFFYHQTLFFNHPCCGGGEGGGGGVGGVGKGVETPLLCLVICEHG